MFQVGGAHAVSREDAVAESWREAFDLALDAIGHVNSGAVRDVTVRPQGVPSCGRACRVPDRRLHGQHVRPVVHVAVPRGALLVANLGE